MRTSIRLLLLMTLIAATLAIPGAPAEAGTQALPGGWQFTVVEYCRNGFTVFVESPLGGVPAGAWRAAVTNTNIFPQRLPDIWAPAGPLTTAPTLRLASGLVSVYWVTEQPVGTAVNVTVSLFLNGVLAGSGIDPGVILDCRTAEPFPPDDRINPQQGATAAVYCRPYGIEVWRVIASRGTLAFIASPQQINTIGVPAVNTLITSGLDIRLYRLTTGEFQINAPGLQAGKEYVFIWSGCPTFTTTVAPPTPTAPGFTPGVTIPGAALVYIVQPGDTLSKIARRFGVSLLVLASINGIVNINRIEAGQVLYIPAPGTVITITVAPTTIVPPGTYPVGARTHVVQRGENLFRIARLYGVSLSALAAANGITNVNLIYAGQVLIIP